jgi:glutathione peroxidase
MKQKKKYRRWKKVITGVLIVTVAFWSYVEIVNRNSHHMTGKQKLLKAVYPLWMRIAKLSGRKNREENNKGLVQPTQSLYTIPVALNNGDSITLEKYKGKKMLLVNTASDCGYTAQYAELQELYEKFDGKLVIIGFPANDFGQQEKGDNETIAQFCKVNFGVTFPLVKKSIVIKNGEQNSIFQWLSDETRNGWNSEAPTWNFSKYLVNEQGILTHYFQPAISPMSNEVLKAVEE